MKIHTTNYQDTLIEVADDIKVAVGTIPPEKSKKTIATLQYEMISNHPYHYTSDDLLFQIFAERKEISKNDYLDARLEFFSKGQPCLRTSPLCKQYGFGIHFNQEKKLALYPMESNEYQNLLKDISVNKIKAMKSGK